MVRLISSTGMRIIIGLLTVCSSPRLFGPRIACSPITHVMVIASPTRLSSVSMIDL